MMPIYIACNVSFWWLHSYSLGTCATRTRSNFCCVFPFIYKGRRYSSCTRINSPKGPWCATTPSYDADKLWGYCPSGGGNFVLFKFSDITRNITRDIYQKRLHSIFSSFPFSGLMHLFFKPSVRAKPILLAVNNFVIFLFLQDLT